MSLPNSFRDQFDRPNLKQRAADLKAGLDQARSHLDPVPSPAGDEGDDAELLRLGIEFEAACSCEATACKVCNEAEKEAARNLPARPASLLFRASDHLLRLRRYLTDADTLEGEEVTAADVAWMKRKPYVREVSRLPRPEDRLPDDAIEVVEHHPWPEAQDRADEIVTAWNAWQAGLQRAYDEHASSGFDDAAIQAGEETAALADRIAGIPAKTAEGFRVKLRALAHYSRDMLLSEVPELADPDQLLSHSLWRDAQRERVPGAVRWSTASIILTGAIDFTAASADELRTISWKWDCLSGVAHALGVQHAGHGTAADNLLIKLAEELTAIQDMAEFELQRRHPVDLRERQTRLATVAKRIIYGDDPADTADFIRDLAVWTAEQSGR